MNYFEEVKDFFFEKDLSLFQVVIIIFFANLIGPFIGKILNRKKKTSNSHQ